MVVDLLDLPAVSVRWYAVPEHLLPMSDRRAPCSACAFVAPAPQCEVMRGRMTVMGLPDCSGGYVYREVRGFE